MGKFILSVILLTLLINNSFISAQSKFKLEEALKSMTPAEIEQKVNELGLTPEEAIRLASEKGVDVTTYLNTVSAQSKGVSQSSDERTTEGKPAYISSESSKKPSGQSDSGLPGFYGRLHNSGVEPFGYNIFQYPASTFEPVLNIPTPPSYVAGPGDEIIISVWGDTKLYHQLIINREGNLIIPDVGPINVNGLTIQQIKEKLLRRMTEVYASLRNGGRGATSFLDVSLGKLRTIQVFVLGEVIKPGGYSLSSLSTMLHALYLSGGPGTSGSLRTINLIRENKVIAKLDFYDYALRGDKANDLRLQDGDILFVPPAGKRVAIIGSIVRPAIYELKEDERLSDLIAFSGGLNVDAYFQRIHVERLVPFKQRVEIGKDIIDIDVNFNSVEELEESKFPLENGDVISIFSITNYPLNRVAIQGNVNKPGAFELIEGMRVKDLILRADSLARNTFTGKATLLRLLPNLRREIIQFNLGKALEGDTIENILLQNEDQVIIYRESDFFPERYVSIHGAVKHPGQYPRYESMSVSDLMILAGGPTEDASFENWELSRIDTSAVGKYSVIRRFNVQREYWNDTLSKGILLKDFDVVNVPHSPKFIYPQTVKLYGYFYYPGVYTLMSKNEKLYDVVRRAGGIRPEAYLPGARFYRLVDGVHRLVPLDLEDAYEDPDSKSNISLMAGDSLYLPRVVDVVQVSGEVFVPSAVLYKKRAGLSYYLEQAGGLKEEADQQRIVVVLPNGQVWKPRFLLPDPDILPGSSIYVPKKIDKEEKYLAIMRDWSTIMMSIAAIIVAIVQVTK